MIRSTVAHVNLAALQAQLPRRSSTHLADDTERQPPQVIAVVKANAYGHGAGPRGAGAGSRRAPRCSRAPTSKKAWRCAAPASACRSSCSARLSVSDLDGIFDHGLTPTISSPYAARAVEAAAARRGLAIGYHLKIDTGMHRLGFRHDNLARTLPEVLASPHLQLEGVFTHFASADVPDSPLFDTAAHALRRGAADAGRRWAGGPPLRHAANSAALLRDSRVWYDAVRPGLLLYGIVPPPLASTIALTPAMSLTSRVVAVKGLRPGEGVGYGWQFTADEPRSIAVVPAGYADGLDTRMAGRASVLVRGHRAPVVGAISMDMMTIDVTGLGDVEPGDEVVIIGRQGDEGWQQIDAREMAAVIGTIPWEVVCRLGTRVERVFE